MANDEQKQRALHTQGVFGARDSDASRRMSTLVRQLGILLKDIKRIELVEAVSRLSENLSQRRGSTVKSGYLNTGKERAAYLAHFLPWNIYRWGIAMGITGEELELKPGARITDLGSGPLSTLFALWVFGKLPTKCSFVAVDKSREILELGLRLWESLNIDGVSVTRQVSDARGLSLEADTDLLVLSQTFNEWLPSRGRKLEDIQEDTFYLKGLVRENGQLFVLEPAARVPSWGVMALRECWKEDGLKVIAPCTHAAPCPLLTPKLERWCHFRRQLSTHPEHAKLLRNDLPGKEDLSVSLFLGQKSPADETAARGRFARILSDPIETRGGSGLYACSSYGQTLIESRSKSWPESVARHTKQGERIKLPRHGKVGKAIDRQSGAKRVPLSDCVVLTQKGK